METAPKIDGTLRAAILSHPSVILDDKDVMRALVAANEKSMGENIVDLRGLAMERLEARLDRLEDTHRSVIAAAYENVAGTNQIQRAVLRMMDATSVGALLRDLDGEIADILRLDATRLVLEATPAAEGSLPAVRALRDCVRPEGFVQEYVTGGRGNRSRLVTLRTLEAGEAGLFGADGRDLRSEACLILDLGPGRLPGMLVLASRDRQMFAPQQGTDLLTFFAGAFQRVLRRWLS